MCLKLAREVWTNHHSRVGFVWKMCQNFEVCVAGALNEDHALVWQPARNGRPNWRLGPAFWRLNPVINNWQHRRYASTLLPALLFTLWFEECCNAYRIASHRKLAVTFSGLNRKKIKFIMFKAIEPLQTSLMDVPWDLAPSWWCNRN